MAQWKRAGPITQRSEDQNLALLEFFYYSKNVWRRSTSFFLLIIPQSNETEKDDVTGEWTQQKYRSAIYGLMNVLVFESEKVSF